MKKFLLASTLFVTVALFYFLYPYSNSRETYEAYLNQHPYTKILASGVNEEEDGVHRGDNPDLVAMQDYLRTMDPALKHPTPLVLLEMNRSSARFRDGKVINARTEGNSLSTSTTWTERGPQQVGGRTRAMLFDPSDATAKKIWAGGVSGGLWYTVDITSAASSWIKVDDFWDNLAVSAMASDPINKKIMYVATGEMEGTVRGGGIWKTTDGGASWSRLVNTQNFLEITDVVVRNESGIGVVYAAVKPGFGNDNPTYLSGLYRSADGGVNWLQVLPFAQTSTQYTNFPTDIEIGADNSIWVGTKKHWWVTGASSTIYKSSTGLAGSWTSISSFSGASFNGQIELCTAPSNAQVIYAAIEHDNKIGRIIRSSDGGSTWTTLTLPVSADNGIPANDFTRGQAWYDLILAVHPTDAATCIIGGIDLYRTTNSGTSWQQITKWSNNASMNTLTCSIVHADQHALLFRPGFPNEIIAGNDGGVFYGSNLTTAATADVFSTRNLNYNVTQFYTAAIHPTLTNFMLGGTQDNGTPKFTSAGFGNTVDVYGGDGAMCFIDQLSPAFQIASYTYNNIGLSTDGGITFNTSLIADDKNGNFINTGDYDNNLKALYTARSKTAIYRVTGVTTTPKVDSIKVNLGTIASAFRVSPFSTTSSNVYVGTQAGRLFKIVNATATAPVISEITGPSFGTGSISGIAFGASESQILVTFFNYGVISIWETRNGGTTWVNCEGNLPNMPVRWVEYHPQNFDQAYIATELGVWSTDNLNVTSPVWSSTNGGLANVRTDMLRIRKSDGIMMAATHGRGVFTALVPSTLDQTITFKIVPAKKFGDPTFKLFAKATSALPISSYNSSNASVISIVDSTATIVGAGTVILTAKQDGNSYFKSGSATQSVTVAKADQAITFNAIADKLIGDPAFTLAATTTSTLAVTYTSSNIGVATILGNTVSIVAAGTSIIKVNQSGNNNYNAAPEATQILTVKKIDQTITFGSIATKTIGDAAFILGATSSATLTVAYSTASDKVTIAGNNVTIVKAGSVTINADQSGNANFNAAPQVKQTFCINPAKPTVTLNATNPSSLVLSSNATTGNQWYLNGTAVAGATNPTITVIDRAGAGSYTVKVTLETCTSAASAEQIIVVTEDVSNSAKEMSLFPNPVKDKLMIELNGFEKGMTVEVDVFDLTGRTMDAISGVGGTTLTVEVGRYANGKYVLKAKQDRKIEQRQFVKE